MGIYINKGNAGFVRYTNSEYIDKTAMIAYINSTLNTANMLTCVTRPRRFGKSIAANMLCAYYDKSCNSNTLFDKFEIANDSSYKEHLNKYPVIFLDVTTLTTTYKGQDDIIGILQKKLIADIKGTYPDIVIDDNLNLMEVLQTVSSSTKEKFIFIIDEWDALCRELAEKPAIMDEYVNLLRRMFKTADTQDVFAGVYMTGILPIKKYGTQSALNDFREYSMTAPGPMGGFLGFNDDDVKMLAEKHHMDFTELKRWYDGYEMDTFDWRDQAPEIKKTAIYNPNSVMTAIRNHKCLNYWAQTEAFESLQRYIDYDFNGVKETLENLIQGIPISINVLRFGNNLIDVNDNEELFTLLIHLGYLTYNPDTSEAVLPNQEIRQEFVLGLRGSKSHRELSELVKTSDKLLKSTWMMDEETVAEGIAKIHNSKVAPNFYNNEQALRSVIHLAYLGAIDHYIEIQELASGKGYADIVFIPRYRTNHPPMIVELKWNKTAQAAIDQIKRKEYPTKVQEYLDTRPLQDSCGGALLLVGINYDKDTKTHSCVIEKFTKE